jgi:hypothetical protein
VEEFWSSHRILGYISSSAAPRPAAQCRGYGH